MFRCLADYHKFSGMYVLRHTCCVCVYACACVRVRACACVCVSPAVPMTWGRVLYSRRMCMPRQMRFRGKYRLRVEKATEPSAIVWQNLDTPMWNKCCRRMLSLACHDRTFRCHAVHSSQSLVLLSQRLVIISLQFLLALSLFMMFAASAAKSSASENLPDFTLCNSMPDVAYSPWGAAPVRPVVAWRVALVGVGGVLTTTACVLEPVCHVDAACAYIGC